MTTHPHGTMPAHTAVSLAGLHCLACADAVERMLKANPQITSVHVDWPKHEVHVGYHAGMIDEATIRSLIEMTGCPCDDQASEQPGRAAQQHLGNTSPQTRLRNLQHGVDVQPITMGTRHDRMQYELPATGAHAHHATDAAASRPVAARRAG